MRKLEEVLQDYGNLAAQLGDTEYKIHSLKGTRDFILAKIQELDQEATALRKHAEASSASEPEKEQVDVQG